MVECALMIALGTVLAQIKVWQMPYGGSVTLVSSLPFILISYRHGVKWGVMAGQNNPDLFGHEMAGKALCLPQTIGSTTGGMVIYCACSMGRQPACMLFSNPIDSLAAAGVILADIWLEGEHTKMPVIDSLGEEFLDYVKTGMTITVSEDGTVEVK